MKRIGDSMLYLAEALRRPQSFSITTKSETIIVSTPPADQSRPLAEVRPQDLDWENIGRLLNDYADAEDTRRSIAKGLGLPEG
jgi:hypothetical protein